MAGVRRDRGVSLLRSDGLNGVRPVWPESDEEAITPLPARQPQWSPAGLAGVSWYHANHPRGCDTASMESGRFGRSQHLQRLQPGAAARRLNGVRPVWPESAPFVTKGWPNCARLNGVRPVWPESARSDARAQGGTRVRLNGVRPVWPESASRQGLQPWVGRCLNGVRPVWPESGTGPPRRNGGAAASMESGRFGRSQISAGQDRGLSRSASMESGRFGRSQCRRGRSSTGPRSASMESGRFGRSQKITPHTLDTYVRKASMESGRFGRSQDGSNWQRVITSEGPQWSPAGFGRSQVCYSRG